LSEPAGVRTVAPLPGIDETVSERASCIDRRQSYAYRLTSLTFM